MLPVFPVEAGVPSEVHPASAIAPTNAVDVRTFLGGCADLALDRSQRKRNKCVAASAKFVPRPSHVAPNGCGAPAEIRTLPLRNEKNCSKGRNNKADLGNCALVQRRDRARVPDIAAAVERGIGVEDLAPSA
jgi:hypothetical protein